MIGHKMLWDAALKPSLDAITRNTDGKQAGKSRFEPIELPFGRPIGGQDSSCGAFDTTS